MKIIAGIELTDEQQTWLKYAKAIYGLADDISAVRKGVKEHFPSASTVETLREVIKRLEGTATNIILHQAKVFDIMKAAGHEAVSEAMRDVWGDRYDKENKPE